MNASHQETIAAIATASGYGGVGIVRVSGPRVRAIARAFRNGPDVLVPRHAYYQNFCDAHQRVIDQGLLIFFSAPHSFTGEVVLELQGHGGPVVLDLLLQRCVELGARLARAGEFTERAFLNDKMDLAQAEAIADLIHASSVQAARGAVQSLQGAFSQQIHQLLEALIQLRVYVEAAIDFPEEEIDFLSEGHVGQQLEALRLQLKRIQRTAQQGTLLREGMSVVIAGRPNAGKSSLLNALAQRDVAIVTDIAGTTRDTLREQIHIDGMPLHVTDTAGLRHTDDPVEQIGVARALQAIQQADRILLVMDASDPSDSTAAWPELLPVDLDDKRVTLIRNKADLSCEPMGFVQQPDGLAVVTLSAKNAQGLDALCEHLKRCMGFDQTAEGAFIARRRHLQALQQAADFLEQGSIQLHNTGAGELLAEDLRHAQQALGEITGVFRSDELLGRIFSSFCIGK